MERKVFCPECAKNGYKPKLLGVLEEMHGSVRFWCKSCHCEIRVASDGERVVAERTDK